MLTNYLFDLIEALVPCMHAVEVALRNSLHNTLTVHYGTDIWFYQPGVLESQGIINLGRALQEAAQKPPLRAGKIVAALSFGFWVSLLRGKYEQRLWQPNSFALQKTVFPHASGVSRQAIAQRFDAILKLRNRCFHHEAIAWISPTLQKAILAVDNFPQIATGRAQVEANLKAQLGIP